MYENKKHNQKNFRGKIDISKNYLINEMKEFKL